MAPHDCPNCGAEVPPNAKACPECGSDEHTGWSDRAHADRLGIPDEEFDRDEFVEDEFGDKKENQLRPRGISWFWWVVAIILLSAVLAILLSANELRAKAKTEEEQKGGPQCPLGISTRSGWRQSCFSSFLSLDYDQCERLIQTRSAAKKGRM